MKKLNMKTTNLIENNIKKIESIFPDCIVEVSNNGKLEKNIDWDLLKNNFNICNDEYENYKFTWPGKNKMILESNQGSNCTLRPVLSDSIDFEKTENLYIEGDNLEVLKLMQEAYLEKVNVIYVDPPYNTGSDFIYKDNFRKSISDYNEIINIDENDNRMFKNTDSNGRFHTDWLNMIYPRLKLARNLLSKDGVIFISIDDNEVENLKKICNEIFGENNFIGQIVWSKKRKGSFLSKGVISLTEYVLAYSKNVNYFTGLYGGCADSEESQPIIKRTNKVSILTIPPKVINTKLKDGVYYKGIYGKDINPIELLDDVHVKDGIVENKFSIKAPFIWSQKMFDDQVRLGAKFVINTINFQIRVFKVANENDFKGFPSYIDGIQIKGTNEDAYEELLKIFDNKKVFDYSKPTNFIKKLLEAATHFNKSAIVMDFFSGSGTTAQSVFELNEEDGGNRKFILVQYPEDLDETLKTIDKKDTIRNAIEFCDELNHPHNICEIGKERIRRVGYYNDKLPYNEKIDYGFRVLKCDSSNMKDVFYSPSDYSQGLLAQLESNIKDDRSDLDILFQIMIEMGISLSSKIDKQNIDNISVFCVDGNYLCACFDDNIDEEVVKKIARLKPVYAVFKSEDKLDDSLITNFDQIFDLISKETIRKIL